MIDLLRECNPTLDIKGIEDGAFSRYGKIIQGYDFSEAFDIMKHKPIPDSGNIYEALDEEMMNTALCKQLRDGFYGKAAIQIGYCNGNSDQLNALEYHKCSEIDAAVTDLVLILGDIRDMKDNILESSCTELFYVPAGTAVELYGTTLHFAPCKVTEKGFKSIIVLAQGTNLPLEHVPAPLQSEDKLLWMQNKWLIAHPDSVPASKGAFKGITGDNIRVNVVE